MCCIYQTTEYGAFVCEEGYDTTYSCNDCPYYFPMEDYQDNLADYQYDTYQDSLDF